MSPLKSQIQDDMKRYMRQKEQASLSAVRLILAEIKQIEIDKRIELEDSDILSLLDKMAKQRRDAISQFTKAGRDDLADKESAELTLIQSYLPTPLSADEINAIVSAVMAETEAKSVQDMGRVMAALKPKIQGRANMKEVSQLVRDALG